MILFLTSKHIVEVLVTDATWLQPTYNQINYGFSRQCRKGPEPEQMDKDMILQEKEAEVGYSGHFTTLRSLKINNFLYSFSVIMKELG